MILLVVGHTVYLLQRIGAALNVFEGDAAVAVGGQGLVHFGAVVRGTPKTEHDALHGSGPIRAVHLQKLQISHQTVTDLGVVLLIQLACPEEIRSGAFRICDGVIEVNVIVGCGVLRLTRDALRRVHKHGDGHGGVCGKEIQFPFFVIAQVDGKGFYIRQIAGIVLCTDPDFGMFRKVIVLVNGKVTNGQIFRCGVVHHGPDAQLLRHAQVKAGQHAVPVGGCARIRSGGHLVVLQRVEQDQVLRHRHLVCGEADAIGIVAVAIGFGTVGVGGILSGTHLLVKAEATRHQGVDLMPCLRIDKFVGIRGGIQII